MVSPRDEEQLRSKNFLLTTQLFVAVAAGLLIYASLFNILIFSQSFLLPLICGIFVGFFFEKLEVNLIATFLFGILSQVLLGPPRFYQSLWLTESSLFIIQTISSMAGGILVWLGMKLLKNRAIFSYILLGIIVIIFLIGAIKTDMQAQPESGLSLFELSSIEPSAERYAFDGFLFLKTFYLMKDGYGYYQAFAKAYDEDARLSGIPPTVQGWRLPTLFYLWKLVLPADGSWIIYLFIIFSLATIVSSFLVASYFTKPELALVSACLVSGYLFFAAVTMWFPFTEYWGLFFAIISLAFYFYEKNLFAIFFASAALVTRELYLIFALTIFLVALMSKKAKNIYAWVAPLAIFGVAYFVHHRLVNSLQSSSAMDVSSWLGGGLWFLDRTSRFAMGAFIQGDVLRFVVLILASLAALAVPNLKYKVLFGGVLWLPMVLFMFIGSSVWREYWGVIYMPFALIFAPIAFSILPHFKASSAMK